MKKIIFNTTTAIFILISSTLCNGYQHVASTSTTTTQTKNPAIYRWLKSLYGTTLYSWEWFSDSGTLINGIWKLLQMPHNKVTFIGSSRTKPADQYYQKAVKLAGLLAQNNTAVISGGGSGIMQAAAEGTKQYHKTVNQVNLGITVSGLDKEASLLNQKLVRAKNFEIRQWLLFNFSCTIVAFPGGIGTLYELSQILTLIDTKHMFPVPIVLIGKNHWQPLVSWLSTLAIDNKFVSSNIVDMLYVTDSVEDAFEYITHKCQQHTQKYTFNLSKNKSDHQQITLQQ